MTYVLYNPIADNHNGERNAKKLDGILKTRELSYLDITALDTAEFVEKAQPSDRIVVAGGDGTLNRLINALGGKVPAREIYYYPTGSGNDFVADVRENYGESGELVLVNKYLENLPQITVNGETRYFLNGIGYGIDGYCCEEGDKLREKNTESINYTNIAIKGLLFHFKPRNATITVDGETHRFENVWLAPTMNGRYYGGGMKVAPEQDRLNPERTVSVVALHKKSKIKTLIVFPSIFKGEHVAHTEMVRVFTGHEISVEFDRPTALQIDGETVLGVTSYSVAPSRARAPVAAE